MKPGDYYVGVVDFFAILMPGAALAAVLAAGGAAARLAPLVVVPTEGAAGWVAFLGAAYVLGHLVHLAASLLDAPMDRVRLRLLREARSARLLEAVRRRRDAELGRDGDPLINAYSWSKAVLIGRCPAAAAAVHRHEADSKFFRSFAVVLLVSSAAAVLRARPDLAGGCVAIAAACLWRYMDQRQKAVDWAYRHVLALPGPDAAPGAG
jgi:hypothetical protein